MMKGTNYVESVIRENVDGETWNWLREKGELVYSEKNASTLVETFNLIPRKTGNKKIALSEPEAGSSDRELYIRGWSIDRLCRVWLIMQVDASDKTAYLAKTGSLFSGASMNELVSLYSALPVLAYAPEWKLRCAEGIRSNIGTVLEAIMYENSYPLNYLDEPAFNQMVLKAFFTEKNVDRITGIDQRANKELALILFDYAHERWAAGRSVDPQLWRFAGRYLDDENFPDIRKLWDGGNETEKKAALLVCSQSEYPSARRLWENGGSLKKEIEEKKLTWHNLNG
ncbi:MAG: EboA domain-containing protein [Bacteroidota bacterium]|nr:EboA domain-containing protein [Bacteroidota bacterium]